MTDRIFKIENFNENKLKQLSWFISCYSSIFNNDTISLYFSKCVLHNDFDLNTIKGKVKSYLFEPFQQVYSIPEIRNFESFNYLVIPFKNKQTENSLIVFTGNLDKLKNKDKVICVLDYLDLDKSLDKTLRVITYAKNNNFNNFAFQNFPEKELNKLQEISNNKFNIVNIPDCYTFIIDNQGNILNSNKKQLSTIYKHPAYLIFS